MKERPPDLDATLELAEQHEAVENAQKKLHNERKRVGEESLTITEDSKVVNTVARRWMNLHKKSESYLRKLPAFMMLKAGMTHPLVEALSVGTAKVVDANMGNGRQARGPIGPTQEESVHRWGSSWMLDAHAGGYRIWNNYRTGRYVASKGRPSISRRDKSPGVCSKW